ncbi:MAG TPA: response regulator [Bacteroidia bacterium]|nr:response regulator [Bacteroidia bacterium]HNU31976.1 response regulator [Bacteroidia bacterium]
MDIFKSSNRSFDRKIYLIFFLLIALGIINSIVSTLHIDKSKNLTDEISTVSTPTLSGLTEMSHYVTRSRMYSTNWVYMPNNKVDKEKLTQLTNTDYPVLKNKLLSLSSKWENTDQKNKLSHIFSTYEKILSQQKEIAKVLHDFEDYQDPIKKFGAEEILETQINPLSINVLDELNKLIEIRKTIALQKHSEMNSSFAILKMVVLGLAILIVVLVIISFFYLSNNFISPIMRIRSVLLKMSKGELPELNIQAPANAVGEMLSALKALMSGLKETSQFANETGKGNFDYPFEPLSENDVQGKALLDMRNKLKLANQTEQERIWMSEGLEKISAAMQRTGATAEELSSSFLDEITSRINILQAAVFIVTKNNTGKKINLICGFGLSDDALMQSEIKAGSGLVNQSIISNRVICFESLKENGFAITSSLAKFEKSYIQIMPLFAGGEVIGAIEFGSPEPLSSTQKEFSERCCELLASGLHSALANSMTKRFLEESLKQADELSAQKQELSWANDELSKKSKELEKSQEELKEQQDELKQVNAELEIKAHLLEERNLAIEEARQSLSFKAEQLEQSSKYKSAFLANMSHELRTPLNSILILAKLLSDNKNNNLTDKQSEHARVIHKSGTDLLMLINDILDLSKIESGKLEFVYEKITTNTIAEDMRMLFSEFAIEKQIKFNIQIDNTVPSDIVSDKLRMEQVIKNLISNAFKFTAKEGSVTVKLFKPEKGIAFQNENLKTAGEILAISVTDTGIGIPEEKQKIIFEAFQQADNSTSRKYGGTGLGLAISREIAHVLGGDLVVNSEPGIGSTFTFYIPNQPPLQQIVEAPKQQIIQQPVISISNNKKFEDNDFTDDKDYITPGDKIILIIEDDTEFLKLLIDYAHIYGYKAIATKQGETGLLLANKYNPIAVILDLMLPDTDGSIILTKLKNDKNLKQIPVHIVTALDKNPLSVGSSIESFIKKPVDKQSLEKLFMSFDAIKTEPVATRSAAPMLDMPDTSMTDGASLKGKTILMADDDMRNIYALTTVLENEGVNIICAYDGKEAIEKLEKNPQIDLVLMDIMMPVMDGYQAMSEIRKNDKYKKLPLLAVTAKAMEGEKEKCSKSGASDYIPKPINQEQLISKIKYHLFQ